MDNILHSDDLDVLPDEGAWLASLFSGTSRGSSPVSTGALSKDISSVRLVLIKSQKAFVEVTLGAPMDLGFV